MKTLLFVVGCFFSLVAGCQHSLSVTGALNRFDLFTCVSYAHAFDNSLELGVYSGLGTISLFSTGSAFSQFGVRAQYNFGSKRNMKIAPVYSFSLLHQRVVERNEVYNEHQFGYYLTYGEKIQFLQSTCAGWGAFRNKVVASNYVAFTFKMGVRYVL